jgi:hypothetical protein
MSAVLNVRTASRYPECVFPPEPTRVFYNLKGRVLKDGYHPMEDFVKRLVDVNVIDYANRLGSWEENVMSWFRLRQGKSNFCLVRYEDLLAGPAEGLRKASPMLGIELTPERIERAIRLSSAEHIRDLEKSQSEKWVTTKGTRQDIPFVREAKSGGWRKRLSDALVRLIEDTWGSSMRVVSRRREIVLLYERWRWALGSRLVGGGFKLP